ncbi:hypothetical protein TomMM35A_03550 [Sphingobium sp. TomMM35A]
MLVSKVRDGRELSEPTPLSPLGERVPSAAKAGEGPVKPRALIPLSPKGEREKASDLRLREGREDQFALLKSTFSTHSG